MPRNKIQHGELELFPYTIQDGIPSMSDSYIMALYDIMEAQHQLRWVFFSGGVGNRKEFRDYIKSAGKFANLMQSRPPFWVIVDHDTLNPHGHILLTDCKAKSAYIHFCFFRCNDKARYTAKFFKEILNIMNYDVLLGFTPATNVRINKFADSVPGLARATMIPNAAWDNEKKESVDAVLYYFLR